MDRKLNHLSVCHVNIRGLNEHKLSAIKVNLCEQFDIITVFEAGSKADLTISGYHEIMFF